MIPTRVPRLRTFAVRCRYWPHTVTASYAVATTGSVKAASSVKKNILLRSDLIPSTPVAQKLLDTGIWDRRRAASGKDPQGEEEDADTPKRTRRVGRSKAEKADKNRVNIVSDELCDDIISYIGPSLDRHKGCDLLDLYPGTGNWSRKLNDYLQPRSHILMEPNEKFYKPFLQDLLDKPGTRIVPLSGIVWKELNEVLTPEYLPHQKLAPQSCRNDSLLVTANIALHPKRRFMSFESIARLVQHQFITAIRSSQIFHRYGQVRLLLWTRRDDKTGIVVRSLQRRQRSAIEIELLCDSIHEVAGRSGPDSLWYIRDANIDRYSAQRVAQRMRDNGIVMPARRVPPEHKDALADLDNGDLVVPGAQPAIFTRPYHERLANLQDENEAKEYDTASDERRLLKQLHWRDNSDLIRFQEIHERQVAWDKIAGYRTALMEGKVPEAAEEPEEPTNPVPVKRGRGRPPKALSEPKKPRKPRKGGPLDEAAVRRLEKEWDDSFSLLQQSRRLDYNKCSDNLHLVRQDPPAMNWDRRQYEPLEISELDFFPNVELSLLDIQPKTVHPLLTQVGPGSNRAADIFDLLLRALLMSRGKSLRRMLDSIWPGAADWVIPRCKSLHDPAVGGKPVQTEYASISPRVMNETQWLELLECWMDWPFRPTYLELLARSQDDSLADDREKTDDP